MAWTERELEQRARRAYELGRLRHSLAPGLLPVPLALISCSACSLPALSLVTAAVLSCAIVGFGWAGGGLERAVRPGLLAGLLAFIVPVLLRVPGMIDVSTDTAIVACGVGGLLAGCVVGAHSVRSAENSGRFLPAAALVVLLTGSLGCVLVGFAGVAGLLAGVALSALPVLAWRAARA